MWIKKTENEIEAEIKQSLYLSLNAQIPLSLLMYVCIWAFLRRLFVSSNSNYLIIFFNFNVNGIAPKAIKAAIV